MICCCTERGSRSHTSSGPVGAVEQERGALGGQAQHVDAIEKGRLVAGDEVGRLDQVGRMDRPLAEAQVRDRLRAGLVRVVDEVALRVQRRIFGDDLHAVLVGADRAVGAQAVEHRAHDVVAARWRTLGSSARLVCETSSSMPTVKPFFGVGLRQARRTPPWPAPG